MPGIAACVAMALTKRPPTSRIGLGRLRQGGQVRAGSASFSAVARTERSGRSRLRAASPGRVTGRSGSVDASSGGLACVTASSPFGPVRSGRRQVVVHWRGDVCGPARGDAVRARHGVLRGRGA